MRYVANEKEDIFITQAEIILKHHMGLLNPSTTLPCNSIIPHQVVLVSPLAAEDHIHGEMK